VSAYIDWKVTTDPSEEPVTLSEAKTHARVDGSDEDSLITALIIAARQWVEQHIDTAIIDQTITAKRNGFPNSWRLYLPRTALRSVTSVDYLDSDRASQTLSTDVYAEDTFAKPGSIYLKQDESWPTDVADEPNSVTVVYQAGIAANASEVPQPIKQAILLLVAHWYENRTAVVVGTVSSEVQFAVNALLMPYRRLGV
jgi:uncharacterized phiE125 gp8 family phage protein